MSQEYEDLRKDAYDKLDINSVLLLGIVNNYCIFKYKVLNQKEFAVKFLDKALNAYEA